jgi:hypothetical protein
MVHQSLFVFYGSLIMLVLGIAVWIAMPCAVAFIVPVTQARWQRIPRPLYVLGITLFVIFPVPAMTQWFPLMEYVGISCAYGRDAYADGLRLVDKHGNLNDGRVLPDIWRVIVYTGVCVLFLWSSLPLTVFYMLFRGSAKRSRPRPRQQQGEPTKK